MTLDDLERRTSPNRRVISPISVVLGEDYVMGLKIHQYFLQRKCRSKMQFLAISLCYLWRYWQGITPSESVKVRHSALASENLPQEAIVVGRQFVADDNTVGYCPRENCIDR